MTRFTPLWQQGGNYAAAVDRNLLAALWPASVASGAVPTAVANTMNVSIPPGTAAVALQAGAGTALCRWDAAEVVTSPTAPPAGNSRIDIVILQVRDPQLDAGVNNDFIFQVISGANSTGTPVAPTVPANAMGIAQYTVPASVANLNGVTIVDVRTVMGSPGGRVASTVVTAGGSFAAADTDLAAVNFTAGAGRRYRLSGAYTASVSTGSTLSLKLTDAANTALQVSQLSIGTPGFVGTLSAAIEVPPGAAGPRTYKLRAAVSSGTATLVASSGQPITLLAEDIGS
jgi:hypothetical protein